MIRNYFLTAWRNLLSNKLNAFINVAGLMVAFTVGILLFLMVHFEFSFDNMHQNKDHLFMAYTVSHTPDEDSKSNTFGYPADDAFRKEVPGIVGSTSFMWGGNGIRYGGKEVGKGIILVANDFFSMFSFPVLAGNKFTPLAALGDLVINESTATAVFGKEDPVGKMVSVKIGGIWKDLRVSALVQDPPKNSSFKYDMLARIELNSNYLQDKNNWNNQHHIVMVQTAANVSQRQVEAQMRNLVKKHQLADEAAMKTKGYRKDANGDMYAMKLLPMGDLHFDKEIGIGENVGKSYLYTLVLIAIVVLVIACFNFVNLNVARAFTRAKEVGVRKTIGAGKAQIFFQLWTESLLLFAIAVVLAVGLAMLLLKPFNSLFVEKLEIVALLRPAVVFSILGAMLLVSFLAGGYPAWMVARFNTVEVLKGKVSVRRSGLLRSGLITFQFIMASLLICSTIVIYKQFQYMRTAPLGFVQESVISIPVKNAENSRRYLRELRGKLASQPQVLGVTGSSVNIGIGEDRSSSSSLMGFQFNGRSFETEVFRVDYDFLTTMGVKPLAGRDFSKDFPTDTATGVENVVISESFAKQFAEKNVVGLSMSSDTSAPNWRIIGVIPDIHLHSLHQKLGPVVMLMAKKDALGYFLVKTRTTNPLETMKMIKDIYKGIEPDNLVNPSYLSENTNRWYVKEARLSTIFCTAAGIAVLLSCLGLFAIVSLVIGQRRKEIGVRKVLGASITGIAAMLSKDFLKLVLLAFVIAAPVGWYFLHKWLDDFVYRTTIDWWVFPAAGLVSIGIALGTISILTVKASMANPVKNLRTE